MYECKGQINVKQGVNCDDDMSYVKQNKCSQATRIHLTCLMWLTRITVKITVKATRTYFMSKYEMKFVKKSIHERNQNHEYAFN